MCYKLANNHEYNGFMLASGGFRGQTFIHIQIVAYMNKTKIKNIGLQYRK